MSENTKKYHDKPLPEGWKPVPDVVDALKQAATNGSISCRMATKIAKDLNINPTEVGRTIDLLGINIIKCQLGLFGYKPEKKVVQPAKSISPELEAEITKASTEGRLPCKAAWDIASRLKISKMDVSSACEAMGIKIRRCQIGAF